MKPQNNKKYKFNSRAWKFPGYFIPSLILYCFLGCFLGFILAFAALVLKLIGLVGGFPGLSDQLRFGVVLLLLRGL
jgi:hypothetical protein